MANQATAGQQMPMNKIEDIKSLLKLQKQMLEGSNFARLIVNYHMTSAIDALNLYKNIKNPKIKLELEALYQAWNSLKDLA